MDDRFVNPYTFVPLPKGGAKRSDCTEATEPVFSGEIKCRLITKTQIAVPDILKNPVPDNVERTEPKEYDFFTLDGKAAIPDRKSTRLNSSHSGQSRMPSSA